MTNTADEVIEKIKKAIRLARRTTERGERDTAMRLAKSLAERNGLAFEEVAEESAADAAVRVDDKKGARVTGIESGLASYVIREHFGVVMMTNRWADGREAFSWFGSRLNIGIARHIHHILVREGRKAWNETRKAYAGVGVGGRRHRESFMQGFFIAIARKLERNPLRNDREQFAAEKKAAERSYERFKESHDVDEGKNRKAGINETLASLGFVSGAKVNLARPCESSGGRAAAIGMAHA